MTANDSDRVAVWRDAETVYAALLPGGPIMVLRETAAAIWSAANSVPREEVPARVATELGIDVDTIRPSVEEFVDRLVSKGLLTGDA